MAEITIGGVAVRSVFDLLGRKENDITYALGWGLAQSDDLLRRFVDLVAPATADPDEVTLNLQRYRNEDDRIGITDIEIESSTLHLIVEAKRGWNLPLKEQLELYVPALMASRALGKDARFVVLTQWGETAYVGSQLGDDLHGIPIMTLALSQVADLAQAAAASERRTRYRQSMRDLAVYLRGVAEMPEAHDNRVYVVSLGKSTSEAGISYIDVVRELGIYWYPAGGRGGWPKTPYNYVGFRYDGLLQSIHHVRSSKVVAELRQGVPECQHATWGPAFVLSLDESIPIPSGVRTGSVIKRNARRVIDIDLLLTSKTISDAWISMQARHPSDQ